MTPRPAPTVTDRPLGRLQQTILDRLQTGPATTTQISAAIGASYQSTYNSLRSLWNRGLVERTRIGADVYWQAR